MPSVDFHARVWLGGGGFVVCFERVLPGHLLVNLERSGLGSQGVCQSISNDNFNKGQFRKLCTYVPVDCFVVD